MAVGLRVGLRAALAASLAVGCGADPLGGRDKILIVPAGQSNATTHELASSLTDTSLADPYPAVRMMSKQAESTAHSFHEDGPMSMGPLTFNSAVRVGFETTLMRWLNEAQPGGFALARYAVGGAGSFDFDADYTADMIAFIHEAKARLGCSRVIIVWEHGERDARDLTLANNYDDWLEGLIADLRAEFGADMPFFYGLLNAAVDPGFYTAYAELRVSQQNVEDIPDGIILVDQDAVALSGDDVHYTADGLAEVGKLFAIAIAAYLGIGIPPIASFEHTEDTLTVTLTDTTTYRGATAASLVWSPGGAGTWTSGSATTSPSEFEYDEPGTYTLGLSVTDSNDKTDDAETDDITVADGISGVTRDPTSGWYYPANATEWRTFLDDASVGLAAKATPTNLWLCQEASGNLADSIGSLTLTAANTPIYQQTITGHARKGVGCVDGTAKTFANASSVDIATVSSFDLWAIQMPASAPGANRPLISHGTAANRSHVGITATTGTGRCTSGANAGGPTGASVCTGAVEWVANKVNRGVLEDDAFFGESTKITPTAASGMTGTRFEIGAQNGALSASGALYAYGVKFTAEDWTDAEVQTLITKLKGG